MLVAFLDRAVARCAQPGAAARIVALALLLASPALLCPLLADDWIQEIRLDPALSHPVESGASLGPGPDLFVFASGDPVQREAVMEAGTFVWWAAPDFQLAFWRPISTATHWLDHQLWQGNAALIHAHSLGWFLALLLAAGALFRRVHGGAVGALALAIYALDDARGAVLGFAANRNALIAALLGVGAIWAHDRWRRDGWRPGAALGPALLGAGLLAGESAIAATGFLFAWALTLDRGSLAARLGRLAPYAAVVLVWRGVYKALGYGAAGSGVYLDPGAEPLRFAAKLVERWPILAAAQLGGPPSDPWLVYPPAVAAGVWFFALLALAGFAALIGPTLRRSPEARFWSIGAVLAGVPISATFPNDRLLAFAGVGAAGLLACLFTDPLAGGRRRVAGALAAIHLILAPLLLPVRAFSVAGLEALGRAVDATTPTDPGVVDRTLVVLNAPSDGMVGYAPFARLVEGTPAPRALRLLSTSRGPMAVSRPDAFTLVLRPEDGFYSTEIEQMTRSPSRLAEVGDYVRLSDLQIDVTEITEDGRAAEARFTFAAPLEDPVWIWRRWDATSTQPLAPWTPPAIGQTEVVPGTMLF